jgi:hypothetical protein
VSFTSITYCVASQRVFVVVVVVIVYLVLDSVRKLLDTHLYVVHFRKLDNMSETAQLLPFQMSRTSVWNFTAYSYGSFRTSISMRPNINSLLQLR